MGVHSEVCPLPPPGPPTSPQNPPAFVVSANYMMPPAPSSARIKYVHVSVCVCHPQLPRSACDPPAPLTPLSVSSQIYMPDSLEYQPVACAIVVNAAGAWAGKLLEAEGLPRGLCKPPLPIQPRKRYWGGSQQGSTPSAVGQLLGSQSAPPFAGW